MSNRYEDEIRKLLEGMDKFVPEDRQTRQAPRRSPGLGDRILWRLRGFNLGRRFVGIRSSAQLVVVGLLLVVIAIFVRAIVPPLGALIGAVGVLLFFIGYGLSLFDIGRPRQETRWRGRVIEMPRRRPWWLTLLRRIAGRR